MVEVNQTGFLKSNRQYEVIILFVQMILDAVLYETERG